jgi:hypothetical protein
MRGVTKILVIGYIAARRNMTTKPKRISNVEEVASGVFAPDVLMPSQHVDRLRRRSEQDGPRRLMIAILEDALNVFCRMVGTADVRGREMFVEAEEWFESRNDEWLFSFESVCAVLGFEPEYLRRGLRAWKRRALERGTATMPDITLADIGPGLRRASGE